MNRMNERISIVILVLTLLPSQPPAAAQAPQDSRPTYRLPPVILFPGWGARGSKSASTTRRWHQSARGRALSSTPFLLNPAQSSARYARTSC